MDDSTFLLITNALKEANDFGKQVEDKNKELKKEEKKELIDLKKLKIEPHNLKRYRNLGIFFYEELCSLSKKSINAAKKKRVKQIIDNFKSSFNDFKKKVQKSKRSLINSFSQLTPGSFIKSLLKNVLPLLVLYAPVIILMRKEIIACIKRGIVFLNKHWEEIEKIFSFVKTFFMTALKNMKDHMNGFLNLFKNSSNKTFEKMNNYASIFSDNLLATAKCVVEESITSYLDTLGFLFENKDKDELEMGPQKRLDGMIKYITDQLKNKNYNINAEVNKFVNDEQYILDEAIKYMKENLGGSLKVSKKAQLFSYSKKLPSSYHSLSKKQKLNLLKNYNFEETISKERPYVIKKYKALIKELEENGNSKTIRNLEDDIFWDRSITVTNARGQSYTINIDSSPELLSRFESTLPNGQHTGWLNQTDNNLEFFMKNDKGFRNFVFNSCNADYLQFVDEAKNKLPFLVEKIKKDQEAFDALNLNDVFAAELDKQNRINETIFDYNTDLIKKLKDFNLKDKMDYFSDKKNYFSTFFPNLIKKLNVLIDRYFSLQPDFSIEPLNENTSIEDTVITTNSFKEMLVKNNNLIDVQRNDKVTRDIKIIEEIAEQLEIFKKRLSERLVVF